MISTLPPATGLSLSGAVVAVLSTDNFTERTTTYADGQRISSCEPASDGCGRLLCISVLCAGRWGVPEVRPEPLLNAYPTIEKKLDGYYLKPSLEVDAYVSRGNSEIVGESSNYYGVLMVLGAGDEQTQGRRTALVHNYLVLSDGYASLHDATLISQSTSGQHRLLTLPGSAQHVSRVNQFLSVYALEGEQANGTVSDSMRLVHSVGQGQNTSSDNGAKGEYVLDTGRIAAMRVLSHEETGTVQVDDVFYLKADGSDSRQYRLYGARVEHFNNKVYSPIDSAVIPVDKFLSQVTLTDL